MADFHTYFKSDTGLIRKIIPNTGFLWNEITQLDSKGCNGTGYYSPTTLSPGDAELLNMPAGSILTPVTSQEIVNASEGTTWTLCGFNLYTTPYDDGRYVNLQLRVDLIRGLSYGMPDYKLIFGVWDVVNNNYLVSSDVNINAYIYPNNNPPMIPRFAFRHQTQTGSQYQDGTYLRVIECIDGRSSSTQPVMYGTGCMAVWLDNPRGVMATGYYTHITTVDDPNEDDGGGNSGGGGGGGDHDDESDKIEEGDESDLEDISATNAGFVTLYKATMAELQLIADELYDDSIWGIVKNWLNKPGEMIAGLMLLPITPAGATMYKPKLGTHTFNVALPMVSKQYKEVDCGSLYIAEYYGGALDYSPYSRIQIFLPFIGLKELDVDDVMGKWLYVSYRIDCYNGDCIAFVKVGDGTAGSASIHYQFTGNCGQQVPTSGADFSAVIDGCIKFATVATASLISAGAAGAAAGAGAAAASESGAVAAESAATAAQSIQASANIKAASDITAAGVNVVMNGKPRVERSGSIGCSLGQMGVLKPFIIRTIPRQSLPAGYKSFEGYPSNISGTLGSFSGYTVVDTVKLKGIPATDSEIAEIERALKGGVYL